MLLFVLLKFNDAQEQNGLTKYKYFQLSLRRIGFLI